jgi:hypothetical protein
MEQVLADLATELEGVQRHGGDPHRAHAVEPS